MILPIYLDYAASTPLDPRVYSEMVKILNPDEGYRNSSSNHHQYGWKSSEAIEKSRESIARLINANLKEIIWTSGATESINLAIKGVIESELAKTPHIITVSVTAVTSKQA